MNGRQYCKAWKRESSSRFVCDHSFLWEHLLCSGFAVVPDQTHGFINHLGEVTPQSKIEIGSTNGELVGIFLVAEATNGRMASFNLATLDCHHTPWTTWNLKGTSFLRSRYIGDLRSLWHCRWELTSFCTQGFSARGRLEVYYPMRVFCGFYLSSTMEISSLSCRRKLRRSNISFARTVTCWETALFWKHWLSKERSLSRSEYRYSETV